MSCPKWFMGASREDKPAGQAGCLAGNTRDMGSSDLMVAGLLQDARGGKRAGDQYIVSHESCMDISRDNGSFFFLLGE